MNKTNLMIETILKACESKKGYAFKLIDLSKVSSFTDYFVICSVNNERQAEAVAEEIDNTMSKQGFQLLGKEGMSSKRWILLDYGDIIVHVFHKDERSIYKLEQLWADGDNIEIEQYGVENWH